MLCLLQYHVTYPVEVQAPQPIDIVGFQQKMNLILRICKRNKIEIYINGLWVGLNKLNKIFLNCFMLEISETAGETGKFI